METGGRMASKGKTTRKTKGPGGRPPLPPGERRDCRLSVLLSPAESELLAARAKERGFPPATLAYRFIVTGLRRGRRAVKP